MGEDQEVLLCLSLKKRKKKKEAFQNLFEMPMIMLDSIKANCIRFNKILILCNIWNAII